MKRYFFGLAWLRLWVLKWVQSQSLRNANGAIFLTRYAANTIQKSCGELDNYKIIPHGLNDIFRVPRRYKVFPTGKGTPIECLYVSNIAPYKHQEVVVKAIEKLYKLGFVINVKFVGGGKAKHVAFVKQFIHEADVPTDQFSFFPFVPNHKLPDFYANADFFIFASSCENMPVTLLEAMAAQIPIASSDRGPMKEVLNDSSFSFDPEDPDSIAMALEQLITSPRVRKLKVVKAKKISDELSWESCSSQTADFLIERCKSSLQTESSD